MAIGNKQILNNRKANYSTCYFLVLLNVNYLIEIGKD
jgi:hypothetical protein